MHRIGMDLIRRAQEHLAYSKNAPVDLDFREIKEEEVQPVEQSHTVHGDRTNWREKGEGALKGRDLLSLLSQFTILLY